MEMRPEIGLASYDRMFPNQDTLPRGGFGNLIALPLQKAARDAGNAVFLDQDTHPYQPFDDQWAFLGKLPKIQVDAISQVVQQAERPSERSAVATPRLSGDAVPHDRYSERIGHGARYDPRYVDSLSSPRK
jgi:hypothetical protein